MRTHESYRRVVESVKDPNCRELITCGYLAACCNYAVWKDGQMVVGVREQPLEQLKSELHAILVLLNGAHHESTCKE